MRLNFSQFQLLCLSQVLLFSLWPTLSLARYGPTSRGGNGSFPILANEDGTIIANAHIDVDLSAFESMEAGQIEKRNDNTDWFNITYRDTSNLFFDNSLELQKRMDVQACATWVTGAVACANIIWDGMENIWDIAFKIKQLANSKQCSEIHGQQGGMYYRYWASGGDCGTTAEQKTIAGAIDAVLRKLEGEWDCNIYCITMTHGGTWKGTLLIGANEKAQYASCGGQFKGCYDEGCGGLTGWYNCNS